MFSYSRKVCVVNIYCIQNKFTLVVAADLEACRTGGDVLLAIGRRRPVDDPDADARLFAALHPRVNDPAPAQILPSQRVPALLPLGHATALLGCSSACRLLLRLLLLWLLSLLEIG